MAFNVWVCLTLEKFFTCVYWVARLQQKHFVVTVPPFYGLVMVLIELYYFQWTNTQRFLKITIIIWLGRSHTILRKLQITLWVPNAIRIRYLRWKQILSYNFDLMNLFFRWNYVCWKIPQVYQMKIIYEK